MNTIKTTIAILALILFTISCSKDDPAPVKTASAEISFENTTDISILDAIGTTSPNEPRITTSNIVVPSNGTILDFKKMILEMNLAHTFRNDLSFTLVSPDGTESLFIKRINGSKDYLSANKLRFSAVFTSVISNDNIDIAAGDYKESQGLGSDAIPVLLPIFSTFQGKSIAGMWNLKVTDHSSEDVGEIKSWKLIFEAGALNQ